MESTAIDEAQNNGCINNAITIIESIEINDVSDSDDVVDDRNNDQADSLKSSQYHTSIRSPPLPENDLENYNAQQSTDIIAKIDDAINVDHCRNDNNDSLECNVHHLNDDGEDLRTAAKQDTSVMNENKSLLKYNETIEQAKTRLSVYFDLIEKQKNQIKTDGTDQSDEHSKSLNLKERKFHNAMKDEEKIRNLIDFYTSNLISDLKSKLLIYERELSKKNEIIKNLCSIRLRVESELEDLTASLFEEANKMVEGANVQRNRIEKELLEANSKNEMLTAEVQGLKLMVITSTPSKPNVHLHPHLKKSKIKSNNSKFTSSNELKIKFKSPSNYELSQNKEMIPSLSSSDRKTKASQDSDIPVSPQDSNDPIGEIDLLYFDEFKEWLKHPTLEPMDSDFMKRIYDEEIYPVFNFKNKKLTASILRSIENQTLTVEALNSDRIPFPKKCAILEVPKICHYRMRTNNNDQWHHISLLVRNRIASVCDLFCYLRYIQKGLVKSQSKDIYWDIMKRRRNIALSKLGFKPIQ